MLPTKFEELVARDITKQSTKMRDPISAEQRLAITLWYLTTGDAHTTIGVNYGVSPTTVGRIVTCLAIWNRLIEKGYLHVPTTEKAWQNIPNGFKKRWNFPHAWGAIDGKHVKVFAPARESSTYYNYKGTQHSFKGNVRFKISIYNGRHWRCWQAK